MSNPLFSKLEKQITHAVELIELMRIQIEELAEANQQLQQDNQSLKQHQGEWEQGLNTLLRKLENADLNRDKVSHDETEPNELIQEEA